MWRRRRQRRRLGHGSRMKKPMFHRCVFFCCMCDVCVCCALWSICECVTKWAMDRSGPSGCCEMNCTALQPPRVLDDYFRGGRGIRSTLSTHTHIPYMHMHHTRTANAVAGTASQWQFVCVAPQQQKKVANQQTHMFHFAPYGCCCCCCVWRGTRLMRF